ncbi:MAG: peptidase S8/S53 domain-containing protein [Monoraphidium minutum]|nr:MAG: peptidase S8/S53 domain-containing protein [Monoraphidium minutum]
MMMLGQEADGGGGGGCGGGGDDGAGGEAAEAAARAARVRAHAEVKARVLPGFAGTSAAALLPSGGGGGAAPAAAAAGVELLQDFEQLPVAVVAVNGSAALAALLASADVAGAAPDRRNAAMLMQSLPLIGQPGAAAAGYRGAGCAVAVLDTGADFTHADLGACARAGDPPPCRVALARDATRADDGARDDASRHGTNVASIVARAAPDARIISLDVFDGDGAYDSDILRAVDWVVANRVCAINLSLGGSTYYSSPCASDPYQAAFAEARAAGILVAVASGNEAKTAGLSAPSCAPAAVSVGVVYDSAFGAALWGGDAVCSDDATAADKVACFSNSAAYLSLLAPGAMVKAGGASYGGTSQAAPHVAAAAAVLKAAAPGTNVDAILSALKAGGRAVRDSRNGVIKPRLDVSKALELLLGAPLGSGGAADAEPPANAVVQINGGAALTGSRAVTLTVAGDDASGVAQACITNDAVNHCAAWSDFAAEVPWTLAAGVDGVRSVYVRLRDGRGNTMAWPVAAAITLDTTPPRGATVVINGGAAVARGRSVSLALAGADGADAGGGYQVCLSNTEPVVACAPYGPPASARQWALAAGGDGPRSVFLHVRDAAGNVARASASILLDTTPPACAVSITGPPAASGGGAPTPGATGSRRVTLSVAAADASRVTLMCVTNDYSARSCPDFEPFEAQRQWDLAGGADGPRRVYVLLADEAGNTMPAPAAATITLDTAPRPAAAVAVNGGAAATVGHGLEVSVALDGALAAAADAGGVRMCISDTAEAAGDCRRFAPYRPVSRVTLKAKPNGPRRVRVFLLAADAGAAAGAAAAVLGDRTGPAGAATIVFDATPPAMPAKAVGFSAAPAGAGTVALSFDAGGTSDGGTGVAGFDLVGQLSSTPPPRCRVNSKTAYSAFLESGVVAGAMRATAGGLARGAQYRFRLCARDGAGNTAPGVTLSVRTSSA